MNNHRFNLLTYLAAVGFLGILLTQAYLVYNGLALRKELFNRGMELALQSALNKVAEMQVEKKIRCIESGGSCSDMFNTIEAAIPPGMIDSLLAREMQQFEFVGAYYYAVFNRANRQFAMGNYMGFEERIVNSSYQVSLRPVYGRGDYVLSVYVAEPELWRMRRLVFWVGLSVVFLFLLLFSFWSTVRIARRQKRLSRVKADFINNMTHELKTPIASISLAAEMLSKPVVVQDSEKILRYASVLKSESVRLQTLVDHVLMSAMLEESKVRLNLQQGSLQQLVEQVLPAFSQRITELNGTIELELAPELPMLNFDKLHMANVLSNLLDNAIKYSRGAPTIKLSLGQSGQHQVISVADKGMGIPPEEIDLIFKNLYRSHTGNLHDVKGFGIGLFYVKKIVELHGGKITVESHPGQGSVFRVFMPAKTMQITS
ncbi:MAG: HAMP domain-containing histidine kinase [Bacteroidetes bacterium]|nr:HAMP domain-containing histidine kinase [Bacteroidota bacterium]